ncbi:MAG: hypothetical protein ACT4P3_11245 [Betaproteobacteria bacterium]
MKTPLKPSLDDDIYEVEQRLSRRREELPRVARAAGRRAIDTMASPAGLAAAAALGFLVGGGLRRNSHAKLPERREQERRKDRKTGKGLALGSLAMSAAVSLIKRALLEKLQSREKPASPRSDRRRVAG